MGPCHRLDCDRPCLRDPGRLNHDDFDHRAGRCDHYLNGDNALNIGDDNCSSYNDDHDRNNPPG